MAHISFLLILVTSPLFSRSFSRAAGPRSEYPETSAYILDFFDTTLACVYSAIDSAGASWPVSDFRCFSSFTDADHGVQLPLGLVDGP